MCSSWLRVACLEGEERGCLGLVIWPDELFQLMLFSCTIQNVGEIYIFVYREL